MLARWAVPVRAPSPLRLFGAVGLGRSLWLRGGLWLLRRLGRRGRREPRLLLPDVLGRVGAGLVGVALLGGLFLLALGGFAGEHWGVGECGVGRCLLGESGWREYFLINYFVGEGVFCVLGMPLRRLSRRLRRKGGETKR